MAESTSDTASTVGQGPEQAAAATDAGLIDAGAALVESVVDYVRQETGDLVHDKVVVPVQQAGGTAALAFGIATVLVVGILFIAAGALVFLGQWIGWPAALFAVGGVMVLLAALLAYIRTRRMQ